MASDGKLTAGKRPTYDAEPSFSKGMILQGRYRIDAELDEGGMSVVYRVTDLHLETARALKCILITEDRKDMPLMQEATLMRRLHHPALPQIFDVFEEDGTIMIVMELIRGERLDRLLARHGPVREGTARKWMIALAEVLRYLHSQDPPVIFRDVKPANIICRPDGRLVLLDLGIAREYRAGETSDTVIVGTRGYAAPEQFGKGQSDARSDIYALGVTIRELLTGAGPDDDHTTSMRKAMVSDSMKWILRKCLATDPEDRFPDCAALLYALRRPRWVMSSLMEKRPARRLAILFLFLFLELCTCLWIDHAKKSGTIVTAQEDPGEYKAPAADGNAENDSTPEPVRDRKPHETPEAGSISDANAHLQTALDHFYDTGEGLSFRDRVLRATPHFEAALTERTHLEEDDAARADAYLELCQFYTVYMFNDRGLAEPGPEQIAGIPEIIRDTLNDRTSTEIQDSAYLRLTLLEALTDLLLEYRTGLAEADVAENDVIDLIDRMEEETKRTGTARESLREMRDDLLKKIVRCRNETKETYAIIQKWKETESYEETNQKTKSPRDPS